MGWIVLAFLGWGLWGVAWAVEPVRVDHGMPLESPNGSWSTRSLPIPSVGLVTSLASPPGDSSRLMYAGLGGVIRVLVRGETERTGTFLDLSGRVAFGGERGLCSMVFHPGYATNGQFFVCYCHQMPGSEVLRVRISRFRVDPEDPDRALLESEEPLISQVHRGDVHFAGDMHFGPDGYLYVSLGDEGYGSQWDNAGRWDHNFFSAILRIDPDFREGGLLPNPHPAVHPGMYLVPPDNPFINRTNYVIGGQNQNFDMKLENLRTEFWAVGFRNPWRMSFNRETGDLYVNDVGVSAREEVNLVVPGGHHGWFWKEGSLPWPFNYPSQGLVDPIYEYEHTEGRVAITGGLFVRDSRMGELDHSYLFADWTGQIHGMTRYADGSHGSVEQLGFLPAIATMALDPLDGSVLMGGDGVHRMERSGVAVELPELLSGTGLFSSVATLTPAAGLFPYEVNQPFWSDHAIKSRWFGLPTGEGRIGFRPDAAWIAPKGTVWVKHFDFPTSDVNPAEQRRLETRVIVQAGEGIYGVTYRWNESGTEAFLVEGMGAEEDILIQTAEGTRKQRWRYPSRTECLTCHTKAGGQALSFNTPQLNRIGADGGHQLLGLMEAGYFEGSPVVQPNLLPAHPELADETVSLEHRVRSYFDVNCSYCHQPAGANRSPWDGRSKVPLEDAFIVGQPAIHQIATLYQVFATNIVQAGAPSASVLYRRVHDLGPLHMPPLGTFVENTVALGLLQRWIGEALVTRPTYAAWKTQHLAGVPEELVLPGADADGDGDPNLHEFLVGTDAKDAGDRWVPEVLALPGQVPTVRFVRKAGRDYRVETATSVTGPWQPVDHPLNRPRWMAEDEAVTMPLPEGSTLWVRVQIYSP